MEPRANHTCPRRAAIAGAALALAGLALAAHASEPAAEGARLTIYNQGFALVGERRALDLKSGKSTVSLADIPPLLDPDSVVLRDPADPQGVRVLVQSHRGKPIDRDAMLRLHEGKTLQFQIVQRDGRAETRPGRLLRAGAPPAPTAPEGYAPIVEIDGRLLFALPGEPLFDALPPDASLVPALVWDLWAARAGRRDLELTYETAGIGWQATYNVVLPADGDRFDLVGWVAIDNRSGATWRDARVALMAGDVNRAPKQFARTRMVMEQGIQADAMGYEPAPPVSERSFDDYHLYTLREPVTLENGGATQVEFCRGAAVPGTRTYVYDGARSIFHGGDVGEDPEFGRQVQARVASALEFVNRKDAGLGVPLPAGAMRVYRAADDGRREIIGEQRIGHTPSGETVRVELGAVFDVTAERRQAAFRVDRNGRTAEESFSITIRNRKRQPVEVRVVEHLYRWANWKITTSSDPFEKKDARTVEFRPRIAADAEKVVTYTVQYKY